MHGDWYFRLRRMAGDITLCVVAGVALGVLFSVVALVRVLVAFAIELARGHTPFASAEMSLAWKLPAIYLAAGVLGGLVVGLTLPLTRWMLGAALTAFLAAFVVWFTVGWSIGPDEGLPAIAHTSAVLGAAFGLPVGIGFWFQDRHDRTGRWL
jgi:hypothetical protein